jgi:hypothetical protein
MKNSALIKKIDKKLSKKLVIVESDFIRSRISWSIRKKWFTNEGLMMINRAIKSTD